jgi:hypothetical protein
MSYVEKAFWDYLKSQIFGGIRILFSRRLVLFSAILFVISAVTTMVVVFQDQILINDELIISVFNIQVGIAIGMIICGLVSKKLSGLIRFFLLIATIIIIQGIYIVSLNETSLEVIPEFLIEFFPLFAFFSWSFLVPLASFAFSKGMFSNKITGSVLFLGKPKTEKKSIFSGVFALIALLSVLWNLAMIYTGLTEENLSYIFFGVIGAIIAFTIILVVQGWIYSDDVFNTTLGFFFVMTLPNQFMIFFTSVGGTENIINTFDYFFVIFSLLYSAQNISRRVKMKGIVIDKTEQTKKKVKEDPFRIGRFIGLIGGEGVVLIYLGLALGFHLIQLQVMGGFTAIFGTLEFSEVYHNVTMIFMVVIFALVMIFYTLQRGKGYWEPSIYRFDFLPPYDDLVDYLEKLKSGEISKTDLAITVGKKAVSAGGIGVFSAAKVFRDKIFGEKKKKE